MVRALLDGSKTQTRRVMKTQLVSGNVCGLFPSWYLPNKAGTGGTLYPNGKEGILAMCPYGQPGDRLWVRETHSLVPDHDEPASWGHVLYLADGDEPYKKWTPSIHMYREHSRILLEIVSVRVERLNDISDDDAVAEGIGLNASAIGVPITFPAGETMPRTMYRDLWESIKGAGSWAANPWVWCVEFRRLPC